LTHGNITLANINFSMLYLLTNETKLKKNNFCKSTYLHEGNVISDGSTCVVRVDFDGANRRVVLALLVLLDVVVARHDLIKQKYICSKSIHS
jgi:hypothetical protein